MNGVASIGRRRRQAGGAPPSRSRVLPSQQTAAWSSRWLALPRRSLPLLLRAQALPLVRRLVLPLAAVSLVAGCMTVGPDYQRPGQPLPDRFLQGTEAGQASTLLEVEWWRRFRDPILDGLVDKALGYNTDIVAAMARIDEADAVYKEAFGGSLPQVDGSGRAQRGRIQFPLAPEGFVVTNSVTASVAANYEIDFWGRMRRTREAARAGAVGSRHGADVTRMSVAAGVAQAYITLRALDEQIRLAERTLASRDEQLKVIRIQFEGGTASSLDFQQARGLRADAVVQLRELQRQRGVAQTQIALLTGEPGAILTVDGSDDPLSRLPVPPVAPPGLPSTLLERRPDIRLAEENLVAANAQIGVAKAAMLPSISLTGGLGGQSQTLASLFDASNRIWNIGFGLGLPIFNGGALAARTEQAEARKRQLIAAYQGAIQHAFKEVSDALVSASAAQVSEGDVAERAQAAKEAAGLAKDRYEGGYSAYIESLDAERTLFAAQQQVIVNRQARLTYAVDLYRAMAGGWSDRADAAVPGDIDLMNAEAGEPRRAPGATAAAAASPNGARATSSGARRAAERSQRHTGRLPNQQRLLPATSPQPKATRGGPAQARAGQGGSVQRAAARSTAGKAAAVKGAASKGRAVKGTAAKGTAVKGTAAKGTAAKGTAAKGGADRPKAIAGDARPAAQARRPPVASAAAEALQASR